MVERDPRVLEALRAVRHRLNATQVAVEAGDACVMGGRLALAHPRGFDLVLLDPPYGAGWLKRVRPLLGPLLADGGWVYLEAEAALATQAGEPEAWAGAGFTLVRSGSAGRVHYHLLRFQSSSCHEDCGLSGNV
jgi:hypothetical protein